MKFLAILLFTSISPFVFALDIAMNYEPYAKYNSSKSHYFITVPKNPHTTKGYTAVIDAKTKTVLFKFDEYLGNSNIYLSNDGKTVYHIECNLDREEKIISWFIQSYTEQKEEKLIFRKKEQYILDDGEYMYTLPVAKFHENTFDLTWEDSTFNVQLSNSLISASKTDPEQLTEWKEERMEDSLEIDSVFHYAKMEISTGNLKERLLSDLNLNETLFQVEAKKYIYFAATIN